MIEKSQKYISPSGKEGEHRIIRIGVLEALQHGNQRQHE